MGQGHHSVAEAEVTAGNQSQGETFVTARCDCGCNEAPPAAGSWARLGAALVRPALESLIGEPVLAEEVEIAQAVFGLYRPIDHVPI